MAEPVKVKTRETNLLALVIDAEPDHFVKSTLVPEYEFSGNTKPRQGNNSPYDHQTRRVFYGKYKERGNYSD